MTASDVRIRRIILWAAHEGLYARVADQCVRPKRFCEHKRGGKAAGARLAALMTIVAEAIVPR